MVDPRDPRYDHLRTWDPRVLEEALRASGGWLAHVGNRIPGTVVLRDHLRSKGIVDTFVLSECFDVMTDLQGVAIYHTQECRNVLSGRGARRVIFWVRQRLAMGTIVHRSHGGTGDCGCLRCRCWRMWLGDLEDALSEW